MRQSSSARPWAMFCRGRWGAPAAILLLLALGACATPPPVDDPDAVAEFLLNNDPLEPANRVLFAVNGRITHWLLGPLGYGYRQAVPEPFRITIRNLLANADAPVEIANHLSQGKPCRAADTLLRLGVNTVFGLGGALDPATSMHLPAQPTDFGLTLGRWGVPSGPYLFLPVVGSTDPRDLGGMGVDFAVDPVSWIVSDRMIDDIDWGRIGMHATDTAERWVDRAREIERTSLDPYTTYRSMFQQHRRYIVEETRADDRGLLCGDRR